MPDAAPPAPGIAAWLLPASAWPQRTVERLAQAQGALPFPAHLTVQSGPCPSPRALQEVAARLERLAGDHLPLVLPTRGLARSGHPLRAATLAVEDSAPLRELRGVVSDLLDVAQGRDSGPHLSLAYGSIGHDVAVLLDRVRPPAELCFDRLALVVAGSSGWGDVASWRVVTTAPAAARPPGVGLDD